MTLLMFITGQTMQRKFGEYIVHIYNTYMPTTAFPQVSVLSEFTNFLVNKFHQFNLILI